MTSDRPRHDVVNVEPNLKLKRLTVFLLASVVSGILLVVLVAPMFDSADSNTENAAAEQILNAPLASPHASVVAAVRQDIPDLSVYESSSASSNIIETFDVSPGGDSLSFLATVGYRELQTDWENLSGEGQWIEVLLPVRPNGTTGWVQLEDVELLQNRFSIRIDRSGFSLEVFDDGELIIESEVAIGTGDTPTPVGTFYTTELLRVPEPEGPYGPYAFVLSGYSERIFDFNGGPGIIGLHGTNDDSSLGTQVSHGCIRLGNDLIAELATFIPLGTPIEIV